MNDTAKPVAGTRRRGQELENAILQAAWEELSVTCYSRLTMEAVADRAGTSKAVIYRRWKSRAELVLAVLRFQGPSFAGNEVPDTGNLREDILALLRGLTRPLEIVGPETLHGLTAELGGSGDPFSKFLPTQGKSSNTMNVILRRAEQRGEIDMAKLSPRVVKLPVDLLRNEWLLYYETVPDEIITEIVDDIFLPLIQFKNSVGS